MKNIKINYYIHIAIYLIPQILIYSYFLFGNQLYFATNDDTTMVALASGAYGSPSEYLLNINFMLGYVTKFLFSYFPVINWLAVIYLVFLGISVATISVIFYRLSKEGNLFYGFLLSFAVSFGLFLMLDHFTFTVIAYALAIAGIICVIFFYKQKEKILCKGNIISLVLFFLAALMRAEVIYGLMIVFTPVFYIITNHNIKKTAFTVVMIVVLMCSVNWCNVIYLNSDPVQKEYLAWGETRSAALDCKPVDFEENEVQFTKMGWSEAEYYCAYNAFYYDKEVFSTENFNQLKEMNTPLVKYSLSITNNIKSILESYKQLVYPYSINLIYFLLFAFILVFCKENRKLNLIIFLLILLTHLVFLTINRCPYRVYMPIYVFGVLLLCMLNSFKNDAIYYMRYKGLEKKIKTSVVGSVVVITLIIFFIGSYCYSYETTKSEQGKYRQACVATLDYLEKNQEKLFIVGDPAVLAIDVARPIFEFAGENNEKWNLIGNWETYSKDYYKLMVYYDKTVSDADEVIDSLVDNDKLLILSSTDTGVNDNIILFLEKQLGMNLKAELVDSIHVNDSYTFGVFKISKENG